MISYPQTSRHTQCMADPRYPVGAFTPVPRALTEREREDRIVTIEGHPARVRTIVSDLGDADLDTPYRTGGWTRRQLVHHLADSHANAVIRFRLTLTEERPTVRPYDQDAWAMLADCRSAPVESSLRLLEGLHERWTTLMRTMSGDQFARLLHHPEIGEISLDFMLQLYAWHCLHHEAHLAGARAAT